MEKKDLGTAKLKDFDEMSGKKMSSVMTDNARGDYQGCFFNFVEYDGIMVPVACYPWACWFYIPNEDGEQPWSVPAECTWMEKKDPFGQTIIVDDYSNVYCECRMI